MSRDNNPPSLIGDEALEYRKVLESEIANHKLYSRITVLTGLGLIVLGFVVSVYIVSIATLGYLLVLVGALRFLNTFYDLQRKDKLQLQLERLNQRFQKIT